MNTILAEYPKQKALGNLVSEQALLLPNRVAVQFENTTFTYQQLNDSSNQLANLLLNQGIKVGDTIGLAVDRSIEMLIGLLAIVKSGAAYVPLDPAFPVDRLSFMLKDSEAVLLITSQKYDGLFQPGVKQLFIEDALIEAFNYPETEPRVEIGGSDLAYILYTSGSTGLPKGVQIEHHNLVNFLWSMRVTPGLNENDVLLSVTTISFDIAGLELFLPLITGAKLIIANAEAIKDGRLLLEAVQKQKVTVMQATPYTWRMMLAAGWKKPLPLKVLCGGEALPKKLADSLLPVCSELWNMYGPTETTIWSAIKNITTADAAITVGGPIANTPVYILDENLQAVADGETGEIVIGGDGVARGYLNRAELTTERFVDDTFTADDSKMYRTGDLGRITADGEILCLGRIDHQVKIRGYRIETEEIEHNLTQLPGVNEAVVVVNTDAMDNQRLIAYVLLANDSLNIDLKDYSAVWTDGLRGKLPDYMLPNEYILIKELPLTPNGKIDRKALPKPTSATGVDSNRGIVAPISNTEKLLVDLWSKYLGVNRISITDNFFDLGGHSIVAVQIMVNVEKITNQRLPIATLFEYPTIQRLAEWIDNADKKATWKSLVRIKAGGKKTPLYIIHGEGLNLLIFNGLANHLDAAQPVYGLQSLGLNGIDQQLDSLEEIAAHYNNEILTQNPDGPYAIVGYSLGGFIAIEMAKQLQAKGKQVTLLGMMDTNLKESDGTTRAGILIRKIKRQFPKAGFVLKSFFTDPVATLKYQAAFASAKARETLIRLGLIKVKQPDNIPVYMNALVEKIQHAVASYQVTPYNGQIHLYKAKTRLYFVDDFDYLGWKQYAKKGMVVNDVPGDHRVMLLPPHDKEFARILQRTLNEAAKA